MMAENSWTPDTDLDQELVRRVQRGDGGKGQFRESLEHLLPAADRVVDVASGVEFGELLDVGASDEAAGLGRAQHQAARRIERQPLQEAVELDQDLLGKRVDAGAGAVEGQHHDAVVALLQLPMLEA